MRNANLLWRVIVLGSEIYNQCRRSIAVAETNDEHVDATVQESCVGLSSEGISDRPDSPQREEGRGNAVAAGPESPDQDVVFENNALVR